jgi:cytochrome c553
MRLLRAVAALLAAAETDPPNAEGRSRVHREREMVMTKRLLMILGSACLLASPAAAQSAPAASAPTFNKDVAPILFANCITCHRPGEVAPMSLLTYADARPWAKGIKAKVVAHEMPPWFADPRYGKFNNKRGLSQVQIDTLAAWVDAGAPQGTGPAPVAPDLGGRHAELIDRPPDAILESGVEITVPPSNILPTLQIWAKHPFTEDKFVEAVENRPANRAVMHHSTFTAAPLPRGAHHIGVGHLWPGGPLYNAVPVREDGSELGNLDAEVEGEEEAVANTDGTGRLGDAMTFYAPGTGSLRFKPGLAKVMKRDDYVRWTAHYNATGRPEQDHASALLWFAKPGSTILQVKSGTANEVNLYEGTETIGTGVRRPNIPAHAENYRVASLMAVRSDTTLNSFWPHMHARGKDMTYSVTYPDGREEILLSVPKYSFEWQIQYQFEEAIKLPAGSMIRVVAHFDNSAKNKYNPAPDQELPWGSQSWHEMYFPHFDLAIDRNVIVLPTTKGTN